MAEVPGKAILSVQNLVKRFGAQPILDGISLTVHVGDRIGLIGRNGCGKSTLMKIIAGLEPEDAGLLTRAQGLRVALLSQECTLDRATTIGEVLQDAAHELRDMITAYHEAVDRVAHTPGECWEHQEAQKECEILQHQLDIAGAWELDRDIKQIATALFLPSADRVVGTLSGGELRRLDLASKLIQRPDILLLDEPTNHIDTRSVEWIENFLEHYPGSCILVTHDRYFLDRVVNRIIELEFSKLYTFPGNYGRFLEYKASVEHTIIRTEENRQAFLRRELAWLRTSPKARTGKQKARIQRAHSAVEEGPPAIHREFLFEIPEPERLGKTILEARRVTHGYGGETLFKEFSLIMQKQMRIGIVGPNGCGKTTLLRVLMGMEEPRKGRMIFGDQTAFLYVDQAHEEIKPEESVLDFVTNGMKYKEINGRRLYVPSYLGHFLFDKASVDMPMSNLSGGERNRIDLVRKLLRGGNFLVLDEPTNDLDLYTLRVLEETLDAFDGCALVVSHDRYFLNRVCTHMLIFEGDGQIIQIAGNYNDYMIYQEKKKRAAKDKKISQRKVTVSEKKNEGPRRLTWKEKNELEHMEENILLAESRVDELQHTLLQPGFYDQEHTAIQTVVTELEAAKASVSRLYARWEKLSEIDQ